MRLSDSLVVAVVFLTAWSPVGAEASFRHRRACTTCQPPVLQTGPQGATSSAFLTGLLPFLSFAQPLIKQVVEREVFGDRPAAPLQCDLSDLSQVPENPKITATRNELAEIQRKLGLTAPGVPSPPVGTTPPLGPTDPTGVPPQPTEPQFFPID